MDIATIIIIQYSVKKVEQKYYLQCPFRASVPDVRVDVSQNDVMARKRFPQYWPFMRGIQRSPKDSPKEGQ